MRGWLSREAAGDAGALTVSEPRFSLGAIAEDLGDDEVAGIAISGDLGRDGDIWMVDGIDLANYKRNPVILAAHNPDAVVGSAVALGRVGADLAVRIRFAPPGASAAADSARALAKAGALRGLSAGIDPIDMEPLDPKRPFAGARVTRAELLEISLVAVPASPTALVMARSTPATLLRSLPAISDGAIERALACVGRVLAPQTPIGLLPDRQRTALYAAAARQRTMTVWALQQAERVRERDYSYARRQEEARQLRRIAESEEVRAFARPRLRPYGM
jgi:HK97 family phage prohead protease